MRNSQMLNLCSSHVWYPYWALSDCSPTIWTNYMGSRKPNTRLILWYRWKRKIFVHHRGQYRLISLRYIHLSSSGSAWAFDKFLTYLISSANDRSLVILNIWTIIRRLSNTTLSATHYLTSTHTFTFGIGFLSVRHSFDSRDF